MQTTQNLLNKCIEGGSDEAVNFLFKNIADSALGVMGIMQNRNTKLLEQNEILRRRLSESQELRKLKIF